MTDRELLELAAKAVAIDLRWCPSIYETDAEMPIVSGIKWNPLIYDGDALRLAVALRMMIDYIRVPDHMAGYIVVVAPGTSAMYESREPDPYAATRRVIVRAAAEIGKELP